MSSQIIPDNIFLAVALCIMAYLWLQNRKDFHDLFLVHRDLEESQEQLKQAEIDAIASLARIEEAKDLYTRGHSERVTKIALAIAEDMRFDDAAKEVLTRAGILHDIGKAVSAEVEGPHAGVGANLAKEYGEDPIIINAIASHHEEVPPSSIYGFIVHLADAISASRPGARKETLSTYIKRLEQLEEIANSFEGVKKAYALQAGREIRVIVDEDRLDDEKASVLAHDIAKKIESEMAFPGEIKVNVIREKRFIQAVR